MVNAGAYKPPAHLDTVMEPEHAASVCWPPWAYHTHMELGPGHRRGPFFRGCAIGQMLTAE